MDQTVAAAQHDTRGARWAWTPSFGVSYEVDLWGRVRHLREAAHDDADAMQALSDAARVSVVAATTRNYARVCAYGEQIDVAEQALHIAQQRADLTQKQRDHGVVSALALARASGLVADARARIPTLDGERRVALAELAVLTGKLPSDVPAAAAACRVTPVLSQPFPVGDGAALLRRRPDLRAAERQLAAADARVGVANAARYPSIVLGASVDLVSSTGSLASLGDRYAMSWGVGPLISWRFPNMTVSRATLQAAQADKAAASATFDAQVLIALKDVEQTLTRYGAQWTRHQALQAASDDAGRALRLAQLNYRAGTLDFMDVLDTERTSMAARATLAESHAALAADQVAVFQALGGGWQRDADTASATVPASPLAVSLSPARP